MRASLTPFQSPPAGQTKHRRDWFSGALNCVLAGPKDNCLHHTHLRMISALWGIHFLSESPPPPPHPSQADFGAVEEGLWNGGWKPSPPTARQIHCLPPPCHSASHELSKAPARVRGTLPAFIALGYHGRALLVLVVQDWGENPGLALTCLWTGGVGRNPLSQSSSTGHEPNGCCVRGVWERLTFRRAASCVNGKLSSQCWDVLCVCAILSLK